VCPKTWYGVRYNLNKAITRRTRVENKFGVDIGKLAAYLLPLGLHPEQVLGQEFRS
jgi:hypothetical protein